MIIKTVRILCVLALVMSVTPKGNARADALIHVIDSYISQPLPLPLHFDNNNMTQELWSITQGYDVDQFDPALGTLTAVSFESSLVPLPGFEMLFFDTYIFVSSLEPEEPGFVFTLDNMLNIDTGLVTQVINEPFISPPLFIPPLPPGLPWIAPLELEVLPLSGSADSLASLSSFVGTGSFPLNATWSGQLLVESLVPGLEWSMETGAAIPPEVAATLTLSLVYEYDPAIPPQPVPEPATLLLLGTGLVGLVGFRKRFKKS